jgi:heme/copper-type cytochrome/quinol oxidase subunit 2
LDLEGNVIPGNMDLIIVVVVVVVVVVILIIIIIKFEKQNITIEEKLYI